MTKVSHYGKSIRKIVKIGECSGITLPTRYLENHGLKMGDHVEVVYNEVLKLAPLYERDIKRELGEAISDE